MEYPNLIPLRGVVQHYDWGGYDFIPNLLNTENQEKRPHAELWMGVHDRGPATVELGGTEMALKDWIASDPIGILGKTTARRFQNNLPFLFKILDVRKMLSIQAHPTKQAAIKGYARENKLGIPLTARHRNYKDDNHKPEIMVALSDFWLLHGFKSADAIKRVLVNVPEFESLRPIFAGGGLKELYQHIMSLPEETIVQILSPLKDRLLSELERDKLSRDQADYWSASAFRDVPLNGRYHHGVFSIYLLNLVRLHRGEGIFQAANIPHAYLEGVNVELMANSDNVFRGGLTNKHVDVAELIQNLSFAAVEPKVLKGIKGVNKEQVFPSPAPDFELSSIHVSNRSTYQDKQQHGPAIYILLSGSIKTEIGVLKRGDIFFSPHEARLELTGLEDTQLFRAGIPGEIGD